MVVTAIGIHSVRVYNGVDVAWGGGGRGNKGQRWSLHGVLVSVSVKVTETFTS